MEKEELAKTLKQVSFMENNISSAFTSSKKLSNDFLFEEAARCLSIGNALIDQQRKDNMQLENEFQAAKHRLQMLEYDTQQVQNKAIELREKYDQTLQKVNARLTGLEQKVSQIKEENDNVAQQYELMKEKKQNEIDEINIKINKLKQVQQSRLKRIHQTEEANKKFMMSGIQLAHLEREHEKYKLRNQKNEQKLETLKDMLNQFLEYLENTIDVKSQVLQQSIQIANEAEKFCEDALENEQIFYESEQQDKLVTPPFTYVKRLPR